MGLCSGGKWRDPNEILAIWIPEDPPHARAVGVGRSNLSGVGRLWFSKICRPAGQATNKFAS